MKQIDARGLSCPQPVLYVQNALREDAAGVTVLVDNMASVENIGRFAAARKYSVEKVAVDGGWSLTLQKQ